MKLAHHWPCLHCTISLQSQSPPSIAALSSPPWPPYHLGGAPNGPPGAPPAPLFSPRCAPVPRRTCCLLLSALRPSPSLPLVAARAVGASLGRGLFQQRVPLPWYQSLPLPFPGARRVQINSPGCGFACSPPPAFRAPAWFLPMSTTVSTPRPMAPHPQDCAPAGRARPWASSDGHGALEVAESSPSAPAGFSL